MGRLRRKRMHKNIKDIKRKFRTRRRTKDIDQIHEDMKPANAEKLLQDDPDLPGSGQHYCISCARYFVNETVMKDHFKTKSHKKRSGKLDNAGPLLSYLELNALLEYLNMFINHYTADLIVKASPLTLRLKDLKKPIYTQHEAEAAAGMGNYSLSAPPTSVEVTAMEDENNSTDSDSDL